MAAPPNPGPSTKADQPTDAGQRDRRHVVTIKPTPSQLPEEWTTAASPYFGGDPDKPIVIAILAEPPDPNRKKKDTSELLIDTAERRGYHAVSINARDLQEYRDGEDIPRWKNVQIRPVPGSYPRRYRYVEHYRDPETNEQGYRPVCTTLPDGTVVPLPEFNAIMTSDMRSELRGHPMFGRMRESNVPGHRLRPSMRDFYSDKAIMGEWAKRHNVEMSPSTSIPARRHKVTRFGDKVRHPITYAKVLWHSYRAWHELARTNDERPGATDEKGVYAKDQQDGTLGVSVKFLNSRKAVQSYLEETKGPTLIEEDDSRYWPEGTPFAGHSYDWRIVVEQRRLPNGMMSAPEITYAVIRVGPPGPGVTNIAQGGIAVQIALEDVPEELKEAAIHAHIELKNSNPFAPDISGQDWRAPLPRTGPYAAPEDSINARGARRNGEFNAFGDNLLGTNDDDLWARYLATAADAEYDYNNLGPAPGVRIGPAPPGAPEGLSLGFTPEL